MACCELVKVKLTIIIIQRITYAYDCAFDCAFDKSNGMIAVNHTSHDISVCHMICHNICIAVICHDVMKYINHLI